MQKSFFLICPTDYLERAINQKIRGENYFYATLGNSFIYDRKIINSLRKIIKKHKISEVYFVLALDNPIFLDALGKNLFSSIDVLNHFYEEIRNQKLRTRKVLENNNEPFKILSYYLNKKIKELTLQLTNFTDISVKIGGKIYKKDQDIFTDIYSDLVCFDTYHLN